MFRVRWMLAGLVSGLMAATATGYVAPGHAAPPQLARITFDFGAYRGWWQVTNATGVAKTGICSDAARCRPWLSLADGSYTLVLSPEPQSAKVQFEVAAGGVKLKQPSPLVRADGQTITLAALKPVTVVLNGYTGPWSLAGWAQTGSAAYFGIGGGAQTIDLVPLTTYGLMIGAGQAERFRLDEAGKVTLIDDRGAVRIAGQANATPRLEAEIVDVAIYPKSGTRNLRWVLHWNARGAGRRSYDGPAIVRLVQGASFQLSETRSEEDPKPVPVIATGKGCNMLTQKVETPTSTLHVVPIAASCSVAP